MGLEGVGVWDGGGMAELFLDKHEPGCGQSLAPPALQRFSASTVEARGAALIDKYIFWLRPKFCANPKIWDGAR